VQLAKGTEAAETGSDACERNSGLAPLQCSAQQNLLGDLHQQKVGERRYREEEEVDRRSGMNPRSLPTGVNGRLVPIRTMPSVVAVSAGLGAALHDSSTELPDAAS